VDVCIALARPLVDTEVEDLGALQEETDQAFVEDGEQGWLSEQTVDPVYVLASDLATADADAPGVYDRLALSTQMRLLDGLPVEIAPPDAAALAQARALFLEELRTTAADATPIWHADAIMRLACAVVRAESDGPVTTTLALERLLAEEDSLAGAWQLALEVRKAGSAQAEEQGDELAAAFPRVYAAAVARMEFLTR
jgi:hypothetical protein